MKYQNDMIPKISENCGDKVNFAIQFNSDQHYFQIYVNHHCSKLKFVAGSS